MDRIKGMFFKTLMILSVVAASLNVNATCSHYINQVPIPDSARRLSRIRKL